MWLHRRYKTVMISAAATACAMLGGVGLSHYAQGEAFSFYKQRQAPWPEIAMPGTASPSSEYPLHAADAQDAAYPQGFAAPAVRHPAAYVPETDEPERYPSYDDPSAPGDGVTEEAVLAEGPSAQAERGAWSEPAEPAHPPAERMASPANRDTVAETPGDAAPASLAPPASSAAEGTAISAPTG